MPNYIDYIDSVIISAENLSPRQKKAVAVLLEETETRSYQKLKWKQYAKTEWQNQKQAAIVLGTGEAQLAYPDEITALLRKDTLKPEGFQIIALNSQKPLVVVHGADDRGLLYGIGKLLRIAKIKPNSFLLPENLNISESPRYSLRGHQLGYRPKTNAYDAWTEKIYEQYIRELALFGANSIEILPPRTDDDATGPHIKKDPLEMMQRLSEIIDSYGMDVWVWYPNMEIDYSKEETIRTELAEREEIFSKLKRIDAVFIPGGDPGDLMPNELFAWGERVAQILQKYHPKAKVWISPQVFKPSDDWISTFFAHVAREPKWLGGLVHGPWVKPTIREMRKMTPSKYPIRNYPDITHSVRCQYPIHDLDTAFAKSLARECINPRPSQEKWIHNLYKDFFIGSLSYSEGINDDVNKFVWSGQDWNPDTPVIETLRDYARFFINPDRADDIAQGILALERNFVHPVAVNKEIFTCLRQWQDLERDMPFIAMQNYRFQMCLLRANYDAYIKRRLAYETELEFEVREILESTDPLSLRLDAERAIAILDKARTAPVGRELRAKCVTLADLLFVNICSQLTVDRHAAIAWGRGAFMDSIDIPLNDAQYTMNRLRQILETKDTDAAFSILKNEILNRTNPGPGGFYDSAGDPESWHRFVGKKPWKDDPGFNETVFESFSLFSPNEIKDPAKVIPAAWHNNAAVLYDTPLVARYENLDPESEYTLGIKYIARGGGTGAFQIIRLVANDDFLIHDYMRIETHDPVFYCELPATITARGVLTLTWTTPSAEQGTHIAELFLRKRNKLQKEYKV